MASLRARVLSTTILSLVVLLLLLFVLVQKAYRQSLLEETERRLQTSVYALMGAAEISESSSVAVNIQQLEPALSLPSSGSCARIYTESSVWQSPSCLGYSWPEPSPGRSTFFLADNDSDRNYLEMRQFVDWETGPDRYIPVNFEYLESNHVLVAARKEFGKVLLWGFLGLGLFWILFQLAVLRMMLSPLDRVGRAVSALLSGEGKKVEGKYPEEVNLLVRLINRLIGEQQRRLKRYRDSLGDLAHSLKTPLAILRNNPRLSDNHEQMEQMDRMIAYHLKKASMAGQMESLAEVEVCKIASSVASAMEKLFYDKSLVIHLECKEGRFQADEGDMHEIIGNLMENACKWAKSEVSLDLRFDQNETLFMCFEDDGPGFGEDAMKLVSRGYRADESTPGHGIGLAVVAELVKSYGGKLELASSASHGARVLIELPVQ